LEIQEKLERLNQIMSEDWQRFDPTKRMFLSQSKLKFFLANKKEFFKCFLFLYIINKLNLYICTIAINHMWWDCGCIVGPMEWGKLSKEETGQVRRPLCTCYPSAGVANRFGVSVK
jgi:hypothetical protein